ncbi:hypothetical protein [Tautonia plasticadhaerens]|uniref:Secreted protein n=1 Tax=Tautonia plasticadhaerens TaxID=2527974 RepID=A0A518HB68_9BACT|nr:hypothetical protein [Tautonia plasticadhaerens]QDV38100.1 hypothetical protein ElP_60490 [Tautonia plasticadhaerens]
MLRKLLATSMTAAVVCASLTLSSVVLPGCGGDDKIRDLPGGEMPVPTAEEKAQLKADYSQK